MTVAEALKVLTERLKPVSDSPKAEAYLLLEGVLDLSRSDLLLNRQRVLAKAQVQQLETLLKRRLQGEPVQHLTGRAHFYGLELAVTPAALIPRPETERLVELALELLKAEAAPLVLDIGTGGGAVALALKNACPGANVVGTDLSAAALELARQNALRHGLRLRFIVSDLLTNPEVAALARRATLLVANLPYLPDRDRERVRPELAYEPELALYSGVDGLRAFRRLEDQAFALLRPGASCLLELDPRNVRQAAEHARHWQRTEIVKDLVGRERFLKLIR